MYDKEVEKQIEWKVKQLKDFLEISKELGMEEKEIEKRMNAYLEDLYKIKQKRKKK